MAARLPNLTAPTLLAAALTAVGMWVWTDRGRAPAKNPPAAQLPSPARSAAVSVNGQALLERAVLTLERHRSLSAKIRQSGSIFGQEPIGTGLYQQQRAGEGLLFRLDLRVQLGEEASSLANVLDDQRRYWTYEKVPGEEAVLTRIDVQRVEDYLQETGQMERLGSVQEWPGLGGLPKLLRSLYTAFDFTSVDEAELAGQRPVPVWRLIGQWNPSRLAQMLPEDRQEAVADGRVELTRLPPQLPEQIVIFLGKDDLFPYRLEYRRETVPTSAKEEEWPPQWSMTLELFEVSFNAVIPEGRFKFPTSLDYTDKTAAFLEGLKEADD
jgi:hypothetical protein